MSIFYPDADFKRIYDIPENYFFEKGITTLLLDVDNTLTTDNNPLPDEKVIQWLETQKSRGIHLMILSNNTAERVKKFADSIGLDFIAEAKNRFRIM